MNKTKKIKIIILAALLIIEVFVWTTYHSVNLWQLATAFTSKEATSIGIIGGADGPTVIFLSSDGEKEADEKKDNKDINLEPELQMDLDKGNLILVNKENPLSIDYKPEDLEAIKYYVEDRNPEARYMRKEAAEAFHILVETAAEEGIELKMTTAYRSYEFQKLLYDGYVEAEGQEEADKFSAKPGRSEHQTGLAVDVSSKTSEYELSYEFGNTTEGKWLAENAHYFGFIIRYPEGEEDTTGYNFEPWHIRYVGKYAADEIFQKNLTLEEYLLEKKIYLN